MTPSKISPYYGAFKHGDPTHYGYNKTIGSNWPYIEDPEVDMVKYHPNKTFQSGDTKMSLQPWLGPSNGISTPIKTIHDNFRNATRETPNKLMRTDVQVGQQLYNN